MKKVAALRGWALNVGRAAMWLCRGPSRYHGKVLAGLCI